MFIGIKKDRETVPLRKMESLTGNQSVTTILFTELNFAMEINGQGRVLC